MASSPKSPPETSSAQSKERGNPLLEKQTKYLSTLSKITKQTFFSNDHISTETRAKVWSVQAELGEKLVNQYAWATPDKRSLQILQYFGSSCNGIVEIGCGANAYWARQMHDLGISVLAFDVQLNQGGVINSIDDEKGTDDSGEINCKKRKHDSIQKDNTARDGDVDTDIERKSFDNGLVIYKGGPNVLTSHLNFQDMDKRVLFLCYPDEDVFIDDEENGNHHENDDNVDEEDNAPTSMGAACLENYKGDTIVHVGELFGDTLSMDQAPWGRSSGAEFQQRLFSEYHCVLKAKLTNWLHVKDTISVWKRSKCCTIVFEAEDENDDNEESDYKYIPEDEMLPSDLAAPCAKHLL